MAGAVIAGCLVASVQCISWINTKLTAYSRPAQKPPQNAESPADMTANLSKVVPAVATPPPAAWRSIWRYSPAVRVM